MIVFLSCYINHHQLPLCIELSKLADFKFIELMPLPEYRKNLGYKCIEDDNLLLRSWTSENNRIRARHLIDDAEILILGDFNYLHLLKKRMSANKLTFLASERWLKKKFKNLFSPRLLKLQYLYHTRYFNRPLYQLCASAYCSKDLSLYHSFKNKCFKWGYFTEVPELDAENLLEKRLEYPKFRLLWIGRLISWKHPDLAIKVAKIMKDKGMNFELNIYGIGEMESQIIESIQTYGLEDCVFLKGSRQNSELMQEIRKHDALLFTSDRGEGWGAVVNEAMSNCCPVIGNRDAGSVPYLIKDGVNGFIISDCSIAEAFNAVDKIYNSKELRKSLALEAYNTMKSTWNPKTAAERLISLIYSLNKNGTTPFKDGPCSKA